MKHILWSLPSLVCTMLACYHGIKDEWNGNAPMIRGLGHAGIYTMFMFAHFKGFTAGTATVACMTMSLFFTLECDITLRYIFLISALGLFGSEKMYTSAILCTGLNLAYHTYVNKDFNFVEIYAYCGHITLLSAVGSVITTSAFILSALLCTLIFLPYDQLFLFLICSVLNYTFYPNSQNIELPTLKKNKMLWELPNGNMKTLLVLLYCIALVLNGTYLCDDKTLLLHFGHVGGIAAVCLTLMPQADVTLFWYVKLIVSSAAMFDFLFSTTFLVFKFDDMENMFRMCLGTRAMLAVTLSNVVFFTVDHSQMETLPQSVIRMESVSVVKLYFKCTCCCVYISFMLYHSLFEDDLFKRLAYITHYCFILGALCLEIIIGNCHIYLNFVKILILSQILGTIVTGQYYFTVYFLVLMISLP